MDNENNDFEFEDLGDVNTPTERGRIMMYYIVFFGSLVFSCTPHIYLALTGMLICGFTVAGIYSARFNSEEDSLVENHMTYLIHTFWYTMLFLMYSIIASATYLLLLANYQVMGPCIEALPGKLFSLANSMNISGFTKYSDNCMTIFAEKNSQQLLISTLIAFLPVFLYLLYRFIRGWAYLSKTISVPMSNE